MANQCTEPRQPGDLRYVYGQGCTWHAPIENAGGRKDETPCCPRCGGLLFELPTASSFWTAVQQMARSRHDYERVMRWSLGRCFPDFDTQESAYRQAMEGEGA